MSSRIHLTPGGVNNRGSGSVPPAQSYQPNTSSRQNPPMARASFSSGGIGSLWGGMGNEPEWIHRARDYTNRIEDYIDTYTQPLKPYLPAAARFLIVVTFLEDALRIITQFGDQIWYLQTQRKFWWGFSHLFLILNVVTMVSASTMVIMKRYVTYAVGGLLSVVVAQAFGYGLIFDISFFLRNLSVIGGLLMVLSDGLSGKKKIFAGLPNVSETDRKKYFQLAGRVLLIFLFLGFIFQGSWSIARVLVSVLGLISCTMVVVGFKAKWSATFLVLLLSVFNVLINNWWSVHPNHPQKDYLRFDFFQTLSIVGGLLLLVNMGPGGLSVDEKKKDY